MRLNAPSFIRVAFLTGIAASLAMMSAKVSLYRPLLAMPGGRSYVFETAGLLLMYGLLVVWMTRSDAPQRSAALLLGTTLGVIAGLIQIAHLAEEEFMDLGKIWNGVSALGLLLCTFVLWGIAGYRATRRNAGIGSSALAGAWSAAVTISMLIAVGFLVEFYLSPPKPEYVSTWGEFQRSGWTDIHAFTIANTLEAAQSHLIIGPIVGAVVGGIGGLIARWRDTQKRSSVA